MKKIALFVLCFSMMAGSLMAADKIPVLLISGDDVSAHNWKEIGDTTRDMLAASGKFDVRISEDVYILESEKALSQYEVIVLTRCDRSKEPLSDVAKENLLNFVKGGKGFMVCHLASASFAEWNEFRNLCGRVWVMGTSGHGPRSVFTAKIVKKDNPITKGMTDFQIDDELYAKLQGDAEIDVLVEADSDWSKKTEPLSFTKPYGQGRVYHHAFGHDAKAISNESNAKLLVNGCEWAATGKVTE